MENLQKYSILKKYYENRDASHGWNHVLTVCKNALVICKTENINNERDLKIIMICALGHDIWDHKYISISEESIIKKNFAEDINNLGFLLADVDLIIRIIDSISLSKEFEMRKEKKEFDLEKHEEILRNVVSDADKLEALGKICIERMIEYDINSNSGEVSIEHHMDHIKKHCTEKLYFLIDEYYIKTRTGRLIAEPLMQEMRNIVDDDNLLENYIEEYLERRQE